MAVSTIPNKGKHLLWTNADPTSDMGVTTLVSSGANDYSFIEVVYKTAHIYNGYQSVSSPYIEGGHITLYAPTGSTGEFAGAIMNASRTIDMSNGRLSTGSAVTMSTSGTSVNNNMCIPYKIYGIK